MTFIFTRPAFVLGLAALAGASALNAQDISADEAADAAVEVAAEAESAIRAIDPTTGGTSLVVDPSLPSPYGYDSGVDVEDLPELPPAAVEMAQQEIAPPAPVAPAPAAPSFDPTFDDVTYGSTAPAIAAVEEAPRGPAARMISTPTVQEVPAYDPSDPFVVKSILPITGTIRYGEWYWDESNAPADGPLVTARA